MPDFSRKAVHRFWHDFNDETIYRAVAFMEGVEEWALDGDSDFEAAFKKLGDELDSLGAYDLGGQDKFIELGAYIMMGRKLRLLQTLDAANPGAASKLLIHAEESSKNESDAPGLFLRRNIVFERLRLLSRVFSNERIDFVIRALGGDDE